MSKENFYYYDMPYIQRYDRDGKDYYDVYVYGKYYHYCRRACSFKELYYLWKRLDKKFKNLELLQGRNYYSDIFIILNK